MANSFIILWLSTYENQEKLVIVSEAMIDSFSIYAKELKEVTGYFKTGDFLPIFPAILGGLWEGGVSKALGAYIWSDFKVNQTGKIKQKIRKKFDFH